MSKFYVYEHWRPDRDLCFYVGKGSRGRAYKFQRNSVYDAVVSELSALGMCVEVRMVACSLSEDEAFSTEIDRIAFWRSVGIDLANRTGGGDGSSGFIRPKGIRLSEAAKRKLSLARIGMKFSAEHRRKLAQRKTGVKRAPFSAETVERMRQAAARREEAKREKFGPNVRRTSRIKEAS